LVNGDGKAFAKMSDREKNMDIPVGPKKPKYDPFTTINRSEIPQYLDDEFYRMYNVFEKWQLGFGMPGNRPWDEQPVFIMDILEGFKGEYDRYKKLYEVRFKK
jgi:hypothetical protein